MQVQSVQVHKIHVFLGLDVLVNNAGIMHTENLAKVSGPQMDEAMDLNVKSALHLTQLATKW